MTIFPYRGVDDLEFSDNLESIKRKLASFKNIKAGHAMELGKRYPSVTVSEAHLYIVFYADSNRVRYFQISGPVSHGGNQLYAISIDKLTSTYKQLDPNLRIEIDGFDSRMFGFSVNQSDKEGLNEILVYSKQYTEEPTITSEDILRYYGSER